MSAHEGIAISRLALGLVVLASPVASHAHQSDHSGGAQPKATENLAAIDTALKRAGNRDYRVVELPGLNHLLQTAVTGAPSEYATIDETIAPQVLELVASWINERFAHR